MIFALHAGLGAVLDEGLDAVHGSATPSAAGRCRTGSRSSASSCSRRRATACPSSPRCGCPTGVDDAVVRRALLERFGIEIGGGVGAVRRQGVAHRLHGPHRPPAQRRRPARRARRGAHLVTDRPERAPVWFPGDVGATTNVGRFMAAHGIGDFDDAAGAQHRRARVVLGRRRATSSAFVSTRRTPRCSTRRKGIAWATWFNGGDAERRRHLLAPRRPSAAGASIVGGRGRRGACAGPTASCGADGRRCCAAPARDAGRRRGRRRRHLPADGARDRRRARSAIWQDRRGLPPAVLAATAPTPSRPGSSDAGAGRLRHRRRHRTAAARRVDMAAVARDAAAARARPCRDRAHRRAPGPATGTWPAAATGRARAVARRQRAPAVHRLHVGHHRPAEGHGRTCTAASS